MRLLAASFTIKPLAFSSEGHLITNGDNAVTGSLQRQPPLAPNDDHTDMITITASILPDMSRILADTDRIGIANATISSQIIVPTLRWKTFPRNVTMGMLDILKTLSKIPQVSKTWKRDIIDAFNDPRFFNTDSVEVIIDGWMPIIRQLVIQDKDRMPDIVSRLPPPSSAGIMFGVGASSARLEADRKAQLNLRRIAFLIISADHDTFVTNLNSVQDKLVDLLGANAASSPSFATRAETFMVLRALLLKITPVHLASLWPIISTELYETLSSLSSGDIQQKYNTSSILQAAKLLDVLLLLAPDDFQLREWLFITDTIDSVYRPPNWRPSSLVDSLAESLDSKSSVSQSAATPTTLPQRYRKPLISWKLTHDLPEKDKIDRVLHPFLSQLSINTFESTYHIEIVDQAACIEDVWRDLFNMATLV